MGRALTPMPSAAGSKQADGADLAGFENRRRHTEGSDGNGFTKWDRRWATMRKSEVRPPFSRKRSYRHGTGVLRQRETDVPGSSPRESPSPGVILKGGESHAVFPGNQASDRFRPGTSRGPPGFVSAMVRKPAAVGTRSSERRGRPFRGAVLRDRLGDGKRADPVRAVGRRPATVAVEWDAEQFARFNPGPVAGRRFGP